LNAFFECQIVSDMSKDHTNPEEDRKPASKEIGESTHVGEIEDIAHRLYVRRARYLAFAEREFQFSKEEAISAAGRDSVSNETRLARLSDSPPQNVSWRQFDRIAEFDSSAVLEKWRSIKDAARDQLDSGQRICDVVGAERPWERAQFLAVRQSMIEEWNPIGGIELSLIDQMAVSYTCWMNWLDDFHYLQRAEVDRREVDEKDELSNWNGSYVTPRISETAYVERSLKMADRFQRMFMRSLRALRDLRRYTGRITIKNEGPLTVGGNQQVNYDDS